MHCDFIDGHDSACGCLENHNNARHFHGANTNSNNASQGSGTTKCKRSYYRAGTSKTYHEHRRGGSLNVCAI